MTWRSAYRSVHRARRSTSWRRRSTPCSTRIQRAFTQRDATEERLRQFLADASHELRTPLTSIQGFAELFRLGTDDPRMSTATIMRRIEEESARMKGLVEDLLLLARLDQVRRSERAPVDLSVLAADACSDAIAADPERPVTLAAPQPVVVLGDAAHLRQALANLATNALRHTPAGTPLEVTVGLGQGYALVEVRDHGPGSTTRHWSTPLTGSGEGTGLGPGRAQASGWPSWPRWPPSTRAASPRPTPPEEERCSVSASPWYPPGPRTTRPVSAPTRPTAPVHRPGGSLRV